MKLFKLVVLLLAFSAVANAQSLSSVQSHIQVQNLNSVRIADSFPGADIGAQINAAVVDCQADHIVCMIQVNKSGTISTPPELPQGFSLSFNPEGQYVISTTHAHPWLIDHSATSFYFNNAAFSYTPVDTGDNAIYIGKGIHPTVSVSTTPSITTVTGANRSLLNRRCR